MGIRNPRKRKREFIALLSTTGSLTETEKREEKQERYIRNFVKTQDIEIVGVVRRNGLGQADLNRQFEKITQLIRQKRAEGVIVVNMMAISTDIADIQENLGFSKKKAIDYLAELEKFGLIEKKRRGLGLASIIYVKSFLLEKEGVDDLINGTSRSVDLGTSVSVDNGIENVDNIENYEGSSGENEDRAFKITPVYKEYGKKQYRSVEVGTSRSVDLGTSRGTEIVLQEVSMGVPQEVPKGVPQEVPKGVPQEVTKGEPLNNNTNTNNTKLNILKSNHIASGLNTGMRSDEMNAYSKLIKENIDYDMLLMQYPYEYELVEGIYDLILETVLNQSESILIASNQYPASLVKSKFLKLDSSHVEYVISCLQSNTTKVKNIKKYLLAALFNAPTTMNSYYQAEVNHDMPQFAKSR